MSLKSTARQIRKLPKDPRPDEIGNFHQTTSKFLYEALFNDRDTRDDYDTDAKVPTRYKTYSWSR